MPWPQLVLQTLQLKQRGSWLGALCRSDFQKIVAKIMKLDYRIPDKLNLSPSVKSLLARIFVKDPTKRITIAEIKTHEWYLHRLPFELYEGYQGFERCVQPNLWQCYPWSVCGQAELNHGSGRCAC
jgi:serine/threonine protein kinase